MTEENEQEQKQSMSRHPDRIGPYQVVDILGEGGMAIVYRARQTEPVSREVAVKVLKRGMDSDQVLARFEFERQALAVLDHAHIQKVFDGGVTEDGRPYFVTEVVRGMPIVDHCDNDRLDTRHRIKLFVDICAAVQHAHQKGVIHRDLKPSNILVGVIDGKPEVKVIDFGVAKAIGIDSASHAQLTRIGRLVGTPQYMSPEQAGGLNVDVDTRTDIYSLGIVLYELLVGALPFDLTAVSDQELPHVLRQREPSRPSARLSTLGDASDSIAAARDTDISGLLQQLRGDLDWIVLKAIAADRSRRYESVDALMQDCVRFLQKHPVLARPPSKSYLLNRFVQRNRAAVLAASAAFLAVLAGATTAYVGMLRAQEAQREAEAARDATTAVVDAMTGLLGDTYQTLIRTSEPIRSSDSTEILQNEPLRHILGRTERLVANTLGDYPSVSVRLDRLQGRINGILGRYEQSIALNEQALAVAREAGLVNEQALLLIDLIDTTETIGDLEKTRQYLDELNGSNIIESAPPDVIAQARLVEGALAIRDNEFIKAREHYFRAVAILEREATDELLLASAYWHVADAWLMQEEYSEAESWLEKSIDILVEQEGESFYGLQLPYSSYGYARHSAGDYTAALENFQRAYNVVIRNFGARHPGAVNELNNIAMAMNRLGRYEGAVANYAQAIDLFREIYPETDHYRIAGFYSNLGNANANLGKMVEATQNYREGLAIAATREPPDRRNNAFLSNNLGRHLITLGEVRAGIEFLEKSIQLKTEIFGDDNLSTARSKLFLAVGLARLENFEGASALVAEAAPVFANDSDGEPERLAILISTEAELAFQQRRFDRALELYIEAYEHRQSRYAKGSAHAGDVAQAAVAVARVLNAQSKRDEVLDWIARSDEWLRQMAAAHPARVEADLLRLENGEGDSEMLQALLDTLAQQYPSRSDWAARAASVATL